jgi:gliding motility-associated-like protein
MRAFLLFVLIFRSVHWVGVDDDDYRIIGQKALSTEQGKPITIQLTDLTIEDGDKYDYPKDFKLRVYEGDHYSVSENTVQPDPQFVGTLTVPVRVKRKGDESDKFYLKIEVTPASNVAPVITGQKALSVAANQSITIQFSDLTVVDPDDSYPQDFSMTISAGSNYSVSGRTITPSNNFTGTLTAPVKVNDGKANSAPFNLSINVTGSGTTTNVAPIITGQKELTVEKDQSLTIQFSDLTVVDPDDSYPQDFSMTIAAGSNYSVSGRTITPSNNFTGTLIAPVTVSDGKANSAPFNLSINVTGSGTTTNVAPIITGQKELTVAKNLSLTIQFSDLTVADPDDSYPQDFSMTIAAGSNYTVSGRTIIPTNNFTGTLVASVTVNDGKASSAPFNLVITVNGTNPDANVAPVITGQSPISVLKNSAVTVQLSQLMVTDPDDNYPNGFTLILSAGSNYTLSGSTITPARDFVGTLNVASAVNDGEANSPPFNLKIDVTETAPSGALTITGQTSLSTFKNQPIELLMTYLIVHDPSNEYPAGFELTVLPGDNYQVSKTTITPALNFVGGLVIPVQISNGKITSNTYNFMLTVTDSEDALEIPTAFTPNDDKSNDTWQITVLKDQELYQKALVRVYNRRGLLVYEASGLEHEWDGKVNGQNLPADVYFYTLEVDPLNPARNKKGTVLILR